MLKHIIYIILSLGMSVAFAQEKIEREYRVAEKDIPSEALVWLKQTYGEGKKVKWYFEKSGENESYEAKFKQNGHFHSVEFDLAGAVEDVEVRIGWNEIPSAAKDNLRSFFEGAYYNYRIDKIQMQLRGSAEELKETISQGEIFNHSSCRFEIEFFGKNEKENDLWEGLFSSDGTLIQKRKIVLRPVDNLNY